MGEQKWGVWLLYGKNIDPQWCGDDAKYSDEDAVFETSADAIKTAIRYSHLPIAGRLDAQYEVRPYPEGADPNFRWLPDLGSGDRDGWTIAPAEPSKQYAGLAAWVPPSNANAPPFYGVSRDDADALERRKPTPCGCRHSFEEYGENVYVCDIHETALPRESMELARAFFAVDPEVRAFVDRVSEHHNRAEVEMRAWDRDEHGWRKKWCALAADAMRRMVKP